MLLQAQRPEIQRFQMHAQCPSSQTVLLSLSPIKLTFKMFQRLQIQNPPSYNESTMKVNVSQRSPVL